MLQLGPLIGPLQSVAKGLAIEGDCYSELGMDEGESFDGSADADL
jgi:hypothetical protein